MPFLVAPAGAADVRLRIRFVLFKQIRIAPIAEVDAGIDDGTLFFIDDTPRYGYLAVTRGQYYGGAGDE